MYLTITLRSGQRRRIKIGTELHDLPKGCQQALKDSLEGSSRAASDRHWPPLAAIGIYLSPQVAPLQATHGHAAPPACYQQTSAGQSRFGSLRGSLSHFDHPAHLGREVNQRRKFLA
jgi:hypothetical protein